MKNINKFITIILCMLFAISSLVTLSAEESGFSGIVSKNVEVLENGDTVVVQTSEVKAHVLRTTGEVWFTDLDGNMLLREQNGGGKSFEPIEVDGTHGYSFRQIFESPDDEAFYGLGQHQADEFNYKGKNEELFQYNTKVSELCRLNNIQETTILQIGMKLRVK